MIKHKKNNIKVIYIGGIVIITALLILIFFGKNIFRSRGLNVLEKSTSVIQIRTGKEVRRYLNDQSTSLLGKPIYAEVNLDYEPINGYTKRDVFNEIVLTLQKNNWQRGDQNLVPDFFKGTLKQGSSTLTVSMSIVSDKNQVTVQFLSK